MIYEVYKRISQGRDEEGNEIYLETGTLVESGAWKNERVLINQGYLGPPRVSQEKLNKFLAKNGGKVGTNTEVLGVSRPPIKKKAKKEEPEVEITSPQLNV